MIILPILVATALAHPVVLDISDSVDPREIIKVERTTPEFQYTTFTSRDGVDVLKIISGSELIWEGKYGERCSSISLSQLPKDRTLASVRILNRGQFSHAYFVHKGDKWEKIDCIKYHDLFFGATYDATFDLQGPLDERKFCVKEYFPFHHVSHIYTSKSRFHITSVTYGDKVLWKSPSEGDRCDKVILHGIPGYLEFVHLVTQEGSNYDGHYFEKRNGDWVPISKSSFFEQMEWLSTVEDTKF